MRKLKLLTILILFNSVTGFSQNIYLTEILGRPTDHSITLNVMFSDSAEFYCEYSKVGDSPKAYTDTIYTQRENVGEIIINGLDKNTLYEYRTAYRRKNTENFTFGEYHQFHTQRSKESTFRFVIEADPHPYDKKCYPPLWEIALDNQLADQPDFMLDLGDTFGDDHRPFEINKEQVRQLQLNSRQYFSRICHSAPLFLCLGNHEGESGYYLQQTPPNNLAVWETHWRKLYYPNPFPNEFYSGNTTEEEHGMGVPENYYSWEWGNALFVVLDAYRYYTASAKPRNWEWTIGKQQYNWLKETLENSDAGFKFVFMHHIMGESRGGILLAKGFEWGGHEKDGTKWTFAENRPGWEMPLHQLMVQNKVNIFFQGHDHLFVQEELDGLIYQTVPMPSDSSYMIGMNDNSYAFTGNIVPGSGHIRVEVSSEQVQVDFVSAQLPKDETPEIKNGDVAYSYLVNKFGLISSNSEMPKWEAKPKVKLYPNPFRDSVNIQFELKTQGEVNLFIYDLSGKQVDKINAGHLSSGINNIKWDAINRNGKPCTSGVYACKIVTPDGAQSEKLIRVE